MTTTQNLQNLAKDPQAFDTELARLHGDIEKATRARDRAMDSIHKAVGDLRSYDRSRVVHWQLTDREALAKAIELGLTELRSEYATAQGEVTRLLEAVNDMDEVYAEHRWTRFFPSVTKSQPHIHRSLTCHTLHATTVMTWAPQLSGKTDEEAVSELDEALCSVCFPSAPVKLHEYVSRKSQAERDARATEKAARDLAKAAKTLTKAEQFWTEYGRDKVTTVAGLKDIIRRAVELAVELDYYTWAAAAAERWTGDAAQLAQVRSNIADSLLGATRDATTAAAILEAREARHEGHGATAEAIAKMEANKIKSARKDWGL